MLAFTSGSDALSIVSLQLTAGIAKHNLRSCFDRAITGAE
jgi:hypothetical protein